MTTFMTMISIIGLSEKRDLKHLVLTVLFLEMTMVGVFLALDVILFYVFWELSLSSYVIYSWSMGWKKKNLCSSKIFLIYIYRFISDAYRYVVFRVFTFSSNRSTGVLIY